MNRKRTALAVAVSGTAAGIVGLVVLATPAGAGEAPPALPPISAQDLVQSVLTMKVPAMSGAVEVKENLGLPMPILPSGGSDGVAARVYADGTGKARIALTGRMSDTTVIEDGNTLWIWDSADKSVRKIPHDADLHQKAAEQFSDPASAAQQLVSAMQQDSNVAVDGTARVADRPVYQLVLTPKSSEKTLLREIRVAVDSETRVPLRLEVLANNESDPALKIGFTEFSPGAQDPSLFQFTVPEGAKVTESKPGEHVGAVNAKGIQDLLSQIDGQVVGSGWDTVVVGKVPSQLLSMVSGSAPGDNGRSRPNVTGLLNQFAKQVTLPSGTKAWMITIKVGSVMLTEDGKAAVGAVPEQVLTEAIGQVK